MSKFPLTQPQLKELAPTLFTEQPHFEVSDKYHFIPTIEIVNQIIAHNWHPVSVSEASVRDENKEGYQQHYVRFRHFEDLLNPRDNAIELLLFNSHDRTKSFSISAGIYRFICANGLVLSDNVFESYKIKHLGDRENDVTTAVTNITNIKSKLEDKLTQLSSINLSQVEKESFAKSTIPLRFEDHLEVDYQDLLVPLRAEDCKDDLYTTLNIIQENLIRGNVSGVNKETGRRFTSREIKSISKDVEVNKGVWNIAERIASIKEPTYQIAA